MNEAVGGMRSVSFGHPERERVQFVFPLDRADSDGWLHLGVTVSCGSFFGTADVYCMISDFARLLPELQRLYETLRGTAVFDTLENQVGFTLIGDGLGHISLRGFLDDRTGGGNRLTFDIAFDQTLLRRSIAEVQALLERD